MSYKLKMYMRHASLMVLGKKQNKGFDARQIYTKHYKVRLSDLDMNFHMTNSQYNFYADVCIVNFMLDTGIWDHVFTNNANPHVMATFIRFRRGFVWKDRFDLTLQIIGTTDKWVFYEFKFIKDGFVHCQILRKLAYHKKGQGFLNPADMLAQAGHPNMNIDVPDYVNKWMEAEDDWVKQKT